jgi:hypothetical protein
MQSEPPKRKTVVEKKIYDEVSQAFLSRSYVLRRDRSMVFCEAEVVVNPTFSQGYLAVDSAGRGAIGHSYGGCTE